MGAGCSRKRCQLAVTQHTFDNVLHGFLVCIVQQIVHFIDDNGTNGLAVDFFLFDQIQYTPRSTYDNLRFFF